MYDFEKIKYLLIYTEMIALPARTYEEYLGE